MNRSMMQNVTLASFYFNFKPRSGRPPRSISTRDYYKINPLFIQSSRTYSTGRNWQMKFIFRAFTAENRISIGTPLRKIRFRTGISSFWNCWNKELKVIFRVFTAENEISIGSSLRKIVFRTGISSFWNCWN